MSRRIILVIGAVIWIFLVILLLMQSNSNITPNTVSFMVFGDPAEKAAYEELVDAFHQKHPSIEVQLIHIPSQSDYRTRIGNDFAAGTPVDVMLINYRRYAAFASRGVLEPLASYLEKSSLIKESDFYPEAIQPFYWNGILMCIPQNISSLVVYYNEDLFNEADISYPKEDWTWDDFLTISKALTRDVDNDGVIEQHGLGTEASIIRVMPFIWQNGGDIVDWYDNPTGLVLDRDEALIALYWFFDLQLKHQVVPNQVEEAAEDSESRFINGRVAMFLNSRRGVPTYREIESFDWDVAPLPRGKERAGILHADAYCMSTNKPHKDNVWTFIEYANSVEGQRIVAKSGRTVPSLISVANSPAFLDPTVKPQNSKAFLDTIPYIRALPVIQTWVDIEEILNEEIERGFYGQVSPDEAILEGMRRSLEYIEIEQQLSLQSQQ